LRQKFTTFLAKIFFRNNNIAFLGQISLENLYKKTELHPQVADDKVSI
jgi:hypothetical protein